MRKIRTVCNHKRDGALSDAPNCIWDVDQNDVNSLSNRIKVIKSGDCIACMRRVLSQCNRNFKRIRWDKFSEPREKCEWNELNLFKWCWFLSIWGKHFFREYGHLFDAGLWTIPSIVFAATKWFDCEISTFNSSLNRRIANDTIILFYFIFLRNLCRW